MRTVHTPDLGEPLQSLAYNAKEEPLGTIGIPVRDHLNALTVMSMMTTAMASGGFGGIVDVNIITGSVLTMQRNELVKRMRGDWLLFIDDDMVWQPDDVAQLVATRNELDLDILGGLCFRRTEPFHPTLYVREQPTSGAWNFLEDWQSDVVEVDATGLAFCLIHKRVFERMVQLYEDRPGWEMPSYEERMAKEPPNIFRWEGKVGEDLRFCAEAKQAGCRVYVDTRIKIGHVGEVTITERDFLRSIATRDPGMEETRRQINDKWGLPTLTREEARRRLGW